MVTRKIITLAVFLLIIVSTTHARIKILTTINPLYLLAKDVLNKNIYDIEVLFPLNVDIHHYEISLKDAKKIKESDFVIAIGCHLEPNIEKLSHERLIKLCSFSRKKFTDPHIWLDPKLTLNLFEKALKDKSLIYNKSVLRNLSEKAVKIIEHYSTIFSKTKVNVIIQHNAWSYLFKKVHINIIGILEKEHGMGISTKNYLKIYKKAKKLKNVVVIGNPASNYKPAKILSQKLNACFLLLSPMGSGSEKSYIDIITNSLEQIRKCIKL